MSDTSPNELFSFGEDTTQYRKLTGDYVTTHEVAGRSVLEIDPEGLRLLASTAMRDTSHLLRPKHLQQLAAILDDPEASANDRFVAMTLLKNANISAGGVLPMCQDTGTAIIMGKKGENVWTGGQDVDALSEGVKKAYAENNLRYSQMAPLSMFEEKGTGTNLPAQIDIAAVPGGEYKFLFMAKGGGSANKTFLHQQTAALLNPESMEKFLRAEIAKLGTAACPPYHLAVVIGGLSAELNLRTVKMASAHYLDGLPTKGNEYGQAFRDL
ncbi:MAG: fumarate hydratase, partial [Magnetovibrio sp.]|nr:fumarate hydratase [Magnetovibrio sp.]